MGNREHYINSILAGDDCQILLDHLPRLVMLIDFDGTILFWNGGGEEVFGYRPEEAEGQKVWFLYPERSKEDFLKELKTLKNNEPVDEIFMGRHKSGSTIWVDVKRRILTLKNGNKVILGTASDITPSVETSKQLAQNKRRMQTILDTAVEGIITIDRHGSIQSFNKAAEEIFGYLEDEVVGENVNILMPSPYHEEHDQYMENYLDTGEKKIIGIGREVRGKRKNGEVFPLELSVSEVKINGELVFTGIVRDISERRRLENEILQISEEERRKIGRELHDGLGQMLTGIGLITQNLANKLDSNELPGAEEAQEIADMIKEADEQARSLAHGFVHLEIEEEGFNIALEQLCKRAKRLFNIECHQDLNCDFEIQDKMTTLHLYRIVQEAISNAVKHGKADEIKVETEAEDNYLHLRVTDNGIGFSNPENRKKLKGIGLNTMSYRAHKLGGYINMRESPEGHTILDCRIPSHEFEHFKSKN